MKKKSTNYLAYLPIIGLAVSIIVGYTKLQIQAADTADKTEKIEEKVSDLEKEKSAEIEAVKKENQELDKVVVEQSIKLQYIQKSVDETNENLKDLLKELKKKEK